MLESDDEGWKAERSLGLHEQPKSSTLLGKEVVPVPDWRDPFNNTGDPGSKREGGQK